jgi:hypothetical protein
MHDTFFWTKIAQNIPFSKISLSKLPLIFFPLKKNKWMKNLGSVTLENGTGHGRITPICCEGGLAGHPKIFNKGWPSHFTCSRMWGWFSHPPIIELGVTKPPRPQPSYWVVWPSPIMEWGGLATPSWLRGVVRPSLHFF